MNDIFNMNMDYMTGMMSAPNYEFPYSGAPASSLPFLNYNPSVYSPVSMVSFVDF